MQALSPTTYPKMHEYHTCVLAEMSAVLNMENRQQVLQMMDRIKKHFQHTNADLQSAWVLEGSHEYSVGVLVLETLLPFAEAILWKDPIKEVGGVLVPHTNTSQVLYPHWIVYHHEWGIDTLKKLAEKRGAGKNIEEVFDVDAVYNEASFSNASSESENFYAFLEELYAYGTNQKEIILRIQHAPLWTLLYVYQWFRANTEKITIQIGTEEYLVRDVANAL
jgi:hypothetical protein